MDRKAKKNLVVALFVAVLSLSIGYAALSSSLNIKGTANVSGEKWQVNFVKDESTNTPSGQAKCNIGTIEDTSITDLSAVFKLPGDSCTFTVPVENTGTLSASLTEVLGRDSLITFTGSEEDQAILSGNVEYSVNYGTIEINDKTVFNNINTLEPGEKETVTLKVTFKSEATKVPKASVTVGGLDRTFVFENKQSTSVAESDAKYSITYEGFDSDGFKKTIRKGTSYIQNLGKGAELCSVKMSGRTLSTSQYTFENGVITISNVTGDIVINGYAPTKLTTPNPPELNGDMIPVRYQQGADATTGNWVKAEQTNKDNDWYDYANQKWANAVTIISDKREEVKGYSAGMAIPMEYINTMWVWIPRYSYTIKSENGTDYYGKRSSCTIPSQSLPGEIDVKFITKDQNDATGNAQYTGDEAINWRTNEAFNFGGEQHAGIWVGKFEPTGTSPDCTNEECDVSGVTILPNEASIRSKTVSNFFYMARSMQTNNAQTYGFETTKGDLHMMKNDEWGAVAYLSQSRYGKQGNSDYSGANKEVYINNNSSYITGTSGGGPSISSSGAHYEYNDMTELGNGKGQAGPGASTTGTIYGVYDMSGGAYEYVMGVLEYDSQTENEHPDRIATGSSGFTGLSSSGTEKGSVVLPNEKYYNTYKSANPTSSAWTSAKPESACDGGVCFGHALSETGNWYLDTAHFVYRSGPWFIRGGSCYNTTGAGVFDADRDNGSSDSSSSSRLVLV